MSDLKKEIRFKNLPLLLKDMEIKKWVIDSFFFPYKNKNYIVILKLYRENEKRPSKYAKEICYQYLELLKIVNKIFDLRVFYEKGIDNLDTVIEEASHTIENMEMTNYK